MSRVDGWAPHDHALSKPAGDFPVGDDGGRIPPVPIRRSARSGRPRRRRIAALQHFRAAQALGGGAQRDGGSPAHRRAVVDDRPTSPESASS